MNLKSRTVNIFFKKSNKIIVNLKKKLLKQFFLN